MAWIQIGKIYLLVSQYLPKKFNVDIHVFLGDIAN